MSHRAAFLPGALLAGKRAVVTGGAAGIGAAIARSFAAHGAQVLVADVDPVSGLDFDTAAGGRGRVPLGRTRDDCARAAEELVRVVRAASR